MNKKEMLRIGREFLHFLRKQRRNKVYQRDALRDCYEEFKRRALGEYPTFGSLLNLLRKNGLIQQQGDTVSLGPTEAPKKSPIQRTHGSNPGVDQDGEKTDATSKVLKKLRKLARAPNGTNGISIITDVPFEDGTLHHYMENEYECSKSLKVKNTGAKPVFLTQATVIQKVECFTLSEKHNVNPRNPLLLKPGDSCDIQVYFRCTNVGVYLAALLFKFKVDLHASSPAFDVARFIEVKSMTSLARELEPIKHRKTCPPTPQPDTRRWRVQHGQRPERPPGMQQQYLVPLPMYEIPPDIENLNTSLKRTSEHSNERKLLESPLTWSNYADKFHLMLFLEELYMMQDFKKYNIPNAETEFAVMKREGPFLILQIPGLSERRPSVIRGDYLFVYPIDKIGVKYKEFVHSTQMNSVKLTLSSKLLKRFVEGTKFHVEFVFSRLTLRIQHRAADFAVKNNLKMVLFPDAQPAPKQVNLPDFRPINKEVKKNLEQYRAVQHIVSGSSKPAPYLIFGPPGTGKTVTVVEAICQIKAGDASHILVCAPTNNAADLLWKKILVHVNSAEVYRLYALSCNRKSVPELDKGLCNLDGDEFVLPGSDILMKYRIIITTLFTAGRLVTGGIAEGHFTHVFVDEAGRAVETECIIPLAGLLNPKSGQVVLAGDPKQLGPIITSPLAKKFGLDQSLLERLMLFFSKDNSVDGGFNERFVTKLLRNYRSHPDILEVPRDLFYGGQLQAFAKEDSRNSCCQWEGLPQPGFPLIFHDVIGTDQREDNSPSFFNIAEVIQLMSYLRKLLETKGTGSIEPEDIGIIAPYRMQVLKINKGVTDLQKDFKRKDLRTIKVGTVEEFQGEERKVIMVSTVRSNANFLKEDKQFNMGFVTNDTRFNVALTRAKALLIVVGHCSMLEKHNNWSKFINFCKAKGGYVPSDDKVGPDINAFFQCLQSTIEPEAETEEREHQ